VGSLGREEDIAAAVAAAGEAEAVGGDDAGEATVE
jgi:hypothetical protein